VAQRKDQADGDLAQRAGNYLIVGVDPEGTGELAPILELLDEVQPFGVILFARNMPSYEALLELTGALSSHNPDLLLAIDHEGGRVHRTPPPFTRFPPALVMARGGDPGLIRDVARAQAEELGAAGFHISFAPVLDVFTNPDNRVIGDRAFGATPEEVVHNALPYLQGLTEGGLLGCGKHFPGHGDTFEDSHTELPRVDHTIERLRSLEFVPFARAISQGVPMIMTAHVLCPALDAEVPASLSRTAVTEWLRERLGFNGAIVSDDLEMRAIADHFGIGEAAVRTVHAGSDIVLVCKTPELVREAHSALAKALEAGEIGRPQESASAHRRQKLLKRAQKGASVRRDRNLIGAHAHVELASRCG